MTSVGQDVEAFNTGANVVVREEELSEDPSASPNAAPTLANNRIAAVIHTMRLLLRGLELSFSASSSSTGQAAGRGSSSGRSTSNTEGKDLQAFAQVGLLQPKRPSCN